MENNNVIRIVKGRENPYSMIANEPVLDKRLSFRARGILWLCLTRPNDWQFNARYLQNMSDREGRDAIQTALRELEAAQYIYRTQVRDPQSRKFAGSIWLVFEVPYPTLGLNENDLQAEAQRRFFEPLTENPWTDEPQTGQPSTANPQLLNTDLLIKTDPLNTERRGASAPAAQPALFNDPETLDFTTPDDLILKAKLQTHARQHGRRGARKFASLEQKQRFTQAVAIIKAQGSPDELERAYAHALTRDRVTRQVVIDSLHRWAENLKTPKPQYQPRHPNRGTSRLLTHEEIAATYAQ